MDLTPGPERPAEATVLGRTREGGEPRPFAELRDSGLLWLINRVVFHPRGFALALPIRDGEAVGWKLLGDGSEVWRFEGNEDDKYDAAKATLEAAARQNTERGSE